MARATVAEMIFKVDAKTRKAERDLNRVATKLRSIRTVGITALIGIAASSGVAAASIAALGTAAAIATLALAGLAAFGIGALAALAIASSAESAMIQETWERVTGNLREMWGRVTEGWVTSTHTAIHALEGAVLAAEPGLRRGFEVIRRLFDRFVETMVTEEMGKKFGDAFGRQLGTIEPLMNDLIDLGPQFADAFIGLGDTIAAELAFGRDGIVEMYEAIAVDLIPAIGDLLGSLISLGSDEGTGLIDLLTAIVDGFTKVTDTINEGDAFTTLIGGLINFVNAFFQVVSSLIETLGPGMGDVFTSLGDLLIALEPALEGFGHLFEDIMGAISLAIERLGPNLGPLVTAFGEMMQALSPVLVDLVLDLADAFLELTPEIISLFEWVTAFVEENPELVQQLILAYIASKALAGPLMSLWGLIKTGTPLIKIIGGVFKMMGIKVWAVIAILIGLAMWIKNLWETNEEFRDVVIAAWDQVKEGFDSFMRHVRPIFDQLTTWWGDHGDKVNTVAGIVLGAIAFIVGGMIGTFLRVVGWVLAKVFGLFDWLGDKWNKFVDAFGRGAWAVDRFFRDIGDTISEISDYIGDIFEDIGSWFSDMWADAERIVDQFSEIPSMITDALGSGIRVLFQFGKDVIQGLIDGFWSMVSRMTSSWNSIVDRIPGDFANSLKIGSPSKVMRSMGEDVVRGIDEGLRRMADVPLRTMNDISGGMAGTPAPSISPAGTGMGGQQIIIVEMDGRQIARAVGSRMVDQIRVKTGVRTA